MDVVLRAAVVFVFLFVLMRVIGRRELSSLEPFDVILLVVLGDLVQQGVTQNDYSVTGIVLAIGTFGLLQLLLSWVNFRFPRLRPLIDGVPVVVVEDGKPVDANLRRERLTLDDLLEGCRREGIERLEDVKWAVMETSGEISFIKKNP